VQQVPNQPACARKRWGVYEWIEKRSKRVGALADTDEEP